MMRNGCLREALDTGKVKLLNVKVLRKINSNTFLVGDISAMSILSDINKPKIILEEGNFVKIIKPDIKDGKIFCNKSFGFVKGTSFDFEFDSDDMDKMLLTATKNEEVKQLSDFDHISTSQYIPCITLKVCSVSRPYIGKFSEYKNVICKDISDSKVTITLYKNLKNSCQQGAVYEFRNLKKSSYKAPGEAHFRLSSTSTTKVETVGSHVASGFDNISIGDGVCVGQFIGKRNYLK